MKKYAIALLVALLPALFIASPAFACSGVYVGSQVSTDGTSIIARCNDNDPLNCPCYVKVFGGPDGEKLTKITSDNGFVYDLPDKIYRFTVLPSCECADTFSFYTSATNECGVSISATLTGYVCPEALAADPYVEGGIVEDMFPAVVGATCSTAREGIDLICKIVDEKGSGENNIIMIADQNECWYMEIYAGHQYCAMKAPDDCVCAMGNEFMIDTVDTNDPNVICSPNLFKLPQEKGYAKYDPNGKMNLFNTYSGENRFTDYSHLRTWRAHKILSPSTIGDYSSTTKYPLFYKPDNKVSVQQVMDFFRDRYEGTEFSPETAGRTDTRCIGTETQIRTHILQTYKDVPADMACVQWLSMSSAEFSTFVPISTCESKFDPRYLNNIKTYENNHDNAYLCFKNLNANVDQNRVRLGEGVKAYWKALENYSTAMMPQILHTQNKDKINDFCEAMQTQSVNDADRLNNDIQFFLMRTESSCTKETSLSKLEDYSVVMPKFSPTVDAALFAKLYNWNIDENKIQDHPGTYDNTVPGDEKQADNGGKEGYVKVSKDGTTLEIHSDNGHNRSDGKLNGETINAYVENGKTFVDISYVDKIKNNDLVQMPKPEAPFEWPWWGTVLICAALVVLAFFVGRKVKK